MYLSVCTRKGSSEGTWDSKPIQTEETRGSHDTYEDNNVSRVINTIWIMFLWKFRNRKGHKCKKRYDERLVGQFSTLDKGAIRPKPLMKPVVLPHTPWSTTRGRTYRGESQTGETEVVVPGRLLTLGFALSTRSTRGPCTLSSRY